MSCCNKKVNLTEAQKKFIESINTSSAVKSSRQNPNLKARRCGNCFSIVYHSKCPVCGRVLSS